MMFQFQVDRTFRSRQLDLMKMFHGWDIINLGDILPDKRVQELLSEIISSSLPSL